MTAVGSQTLAVDPLTMSFVTRTGAEPAGGNPAKVFIIIPRPRAYLADLLIKSFEGRTDVEIIVDRRHGERRTRNLSRDMERRWAERRLHKEGVIEVIVGLTGKPEGPDGGST